LLLEKNAISKRKKSIARTRHDHSRRWKTTVEKMVGSQNKFKTNLNKKSGRMVSETFDDSVKCEW
jgi:hypothetical protein